MYKCGEKFLVGDVGGTNVRLGLASRNESGNICITNIYKTSSDHIPSLDVVISKYLSALPKRPRRAALAIVGPIHNNCITLTNRDWTVSQAKLTQGFGFEKVSLYNDFAAMARAVPECCDADFRPLNKGTPNPEAPILVAGPGTGFGVAILVPFRRNGNKSWKVLSTEGGHQAYAPQTRMETEIFHILQEEYNFVSLELISSGSGMDAVHQAICTYLGQAYIQISPTLIRKKALKAIAAPLPKITFMPTGGINGASAPNYLALPNVIAVGGSWMIDKHALTSRDFEHVEKMARHAITQLVL